MKFEYHLLEFTVNENNYKSLGGRAGLLVAIVCMALRIFGVVPIKPWAIVVFSILGVLIWDFATCAIFFAKNKVPLEDVKTMLSENLDLDAAKKELNEENAPETTNEQPQQIKIEQKIKNKDEEETKVVRAPKIDGVYNKELYEEICGRIVAIATKHSFPQTITESIEEFTKNYDINNFDMTNVCGLFVYLSLYNNKTFTDEIATLLPMMRYIIYEITYTAGYKDTKNLIKTLEKNDVLNETEKKFYTEALFSNGGLIALASENEDMATMYDSALFISDKSFKDCYKNFEAIGNYELFELPQDAVVDFFAQLKDLGYKYFTVNNRQMFSIDSFLAV